jgi:hypothetical protein
VTAAEWLAQAKAVTDAATPGPWHTSRDDRYQYVVGAQHSVCETGVLDDALDDASVALIKADAAFIAASRTMLPAAVAAIEAALALHEPAPVYLLSDECGHVDHTVIESDWGGYLCADSPTGDRFCPECSHPGDGELTAYPCPTVRVITAALGEDPS